MPALSDRQTDVLVATSVAVASVAVLLVADEPGARPADVPAVVLLLTMALPLVWRRRWPVAVVAVVSAVALASFTSGYPGGPPTLPLLVALYSVAAAGHRWWTAAVTVLFAGVGLLYRAVVEAESPVAIALNSGLYVLVSLLGDAMNSRRRLAEETRERLRLAHAEREVEAERQVTQERLHIVQELHDVMAHSVTTLSVQAAAALDALDTRPDDARRMLRSMRTASRQAMQELRATVSVLRDRGDGHPTRQPTPSLSDLDQLIAGVEQAGLKVEVRQAGHAGSLSPAVELTAFRVVQEGLTNVIRHADATIARIALTNAPDLLTVQVEDDGHGPPPAGGDRGFGLSGLQERVEAVGGKLRWGPAPAGGFRLRADLPHDKVDG